MANKNVKIALGLYPLEGIKLKEHEINKNVSFIEKNKEKIIAVGEIGLDFKFNHDKKQVEIFEKLLRLSEKIKKPVIIHSRGAEKEILKILPSFKLKNVVMHYFSGDLDLINDEYYYTVNVSIVERKKVQELARRLDITQILTESDSPFVNIKKRNSRVEDVKEAVEKIAQIRNLPLDTIKDTIFKNYKKCFHE